MLSGWFPWIFHGFSMVFPWEKHGKRQGFLLVQDLGECFYEPGSDGQVTKVLTDSAVTTAEAELRGSSGARRRAGLRRCEKFWKSYIYSI